MADNTFRTTTPIYADAFGVGISGIWKDTKFANQADEMAFVKACNSMLLSNKESERDRRELLYSSVKGMFSTDKESDALNERFYALPSDNSYFTRAIRLLCSVYNSSPQRTFVGLSDVEQATLNDILTKAQLDSILQKCYRLAKVSDEVLIRPTIVKNELELQFLTADQYRYFLDSDGEIVELWIPFTRYVMDRGSEVATVLFHKWTKANYQVVDGKGIPRGFKDVQKVNGQIMSIDLSLAPNPYGRVPFVRMNLTSQDADISKRYGSSMWELVKAQLTANLIDYCFLENLVYTSYPILTLINYNLGKEALTMGAGRVLSNENVKSNEDSPIPPQASFINPQTSFTELEELKNSYMKRVLKNLGLPNSFVEQSSGVQSGVAMKIERQELEEQRLEDISVLKQFEKELIQMIAFVATTDKASRYQGTLTTEFDTIIDYADFEVFSEPKDDLVLLTSKLQAGLLSLKDYVQRLSGADNIGTNEEALEYIKSNLSFFKQLEELKNVSNENQAIPLA